MKVSVLKTSMSKSGVMVISHTAEHTYHTVEYTYYSSVFHSCSQFQDKGRRELYKLGHVIE